MIAKITSILNNLIVNRYRQNYIAKEHGVSGSYISTINKRINQLKYKPKIKDNKLVCLACEIESNLCIHHNHNNGRPIAILCRTCNSKFGNKAEFDGKVTINSYNIKDTTYNLEKHIKGIQITIPDELIEKLKEAWRKDKPYESQRANHILMKLIITYLDNRKINKDNRKE